LKWLEKQKALMDLETNPFYYKSSEQTPLLALWKRISSDRTIAVFRKPVSVKDGKKVCMYIHIYMLDCWMRVYLMK